MVSQAEIDSRTVGSDIIVECDVVMANPSGLNVRQAVSLAQAAARYQAAVVIEKDGEAADGRSILDLLLLEAHRGNRLHIKAAGTYARELLDELTALVEHPFGEERRSA